MNHSAAHSPDPGLLDWTLPDELRPGNHDAAVALVDAYYAADGGHVGYSGSHFDVLGGGGDRGNNRDRFTCTDLLAMGLVSVALERHSILTLLGEHKPEVMARAEPLLAALPADLDLKDAGDDVLATAEKLRSTLLSAPGIGWLTASKLMARKRPRLIPIIDSVVVQTLNHPADGKFWIRLREHLRTNDLHARLGAIRDSSNAPAETSAIRIFDVVVWMVGKDRRPGR